MPPVSRDEAVTTVVDPQLSTDARRRLVRKINNRSGDRWITRGAVGVFVSLVALVITFISVFVNNWSWWAFGASAISLVIFLFITAVAANGMPDDEDRSHFVDKENLDARCVSLLWRVQNAITTVLSSDVYSDNLLERSVNEQALRIHEWEIAQALREITRLNETLESNTKGGSPGPRTDAVLSSHRQALTIARKATVERIEALERFAAQVTAADNAKRDWRRAMEVSDFNEKYRDLVARTAADEIAMVEIAGMTNHAAAAAQVFSDSLHEASLSAEVLALPRERKPGIPLPALFGAHSAPQGAAPSRVR